MTITEPDTDWPHDPDLDELERLSNSVVDLINHGRLDDAERACLELKRRYPDVIDWIDRTGAVHEARGEVNKAIERYRQCLDFISRNPDGFDEDSKDFYRCEIDRLESRHER
jgi:hypothetical protein